MKKNLINDIKAPTEVLGLHLCDLSFRDICEEITDVKKDIAAIEDFYAGRITASELSRCTSFSPSKLNELREGLKVLFVWKADIIFANS